MKRPFLRISLSTLWLSIALTSACEADPETPEPPHMTVSISSATPLADGSYRIVAEIAHFDPGAGLHGQLSISGNDGTLISIDVDQVDSAHLELDSPPLYGLTHYSAMLWLTDQFGAPIEAKKSWTTDPPVITMITPSIHDTSVLTMTGSGFPHVQSLQLGLRSSADTDEVFEELLEVACELNRCTARVPVILATIDEPPVFAGALQPVTVYFAGHTPDTGMPYRVAAGTTQLAYLADAPHPATGAPGSEFDLKLFHPARAPDLEGLTVFFDEEPLTPLSVTELGDVSVGGWIYATRSRYRVPDGAAAGKHRLRVETAYGEEFTYVGRDFEIVAAR